MEGAREEEVEKGGEGCGEGWRANSHKRWVRKRPRGVEGPMRVRGSGGGAWMAGRSPWGGEGWERGGNEGRGGGREPWETEAQRPAMPVPKESLESPRRRTRVD